MTRVAERWTVEFFIAVLLVLVAFGVLMTYSSSVFYAQDVFKNRFYFFNRELLWIAIGLFAAFIAATVNYRTVQRFSVVILLAATVLLALVLIPGIGCRVNHASRWLRIAGFTLQPSEFAKYAVIVFVAAYMANYRRHVPRLLRGVLLPLVIIMVPVALIVVEPDLGTPILILATVLVMLFVGGARLKHLLGMVLLAIPIIASLIVMYPYRLQRLLIFLNPDKDPLHTGFHINQSLIAIGSGRLRGVGLGASMQKINYLPEAHTDFVFAIMGEELGFVGCALLISLFLMLFWFMYRLTRQIHDLFGYLVAIGIMTVLSLQTIVNIGVVTGCMPTKGISLPFISYGGSSLVMALAACGFLVNIVLHQQRAEHTALPAYACGETIV